MIGRLPAVEVCVSFSRNAEHGVAGGAVFASRPPLASHFSPCLNGQRVN